MSINRVIISGNLTRDPELRQTQGGTSVLTMGVAVNDRRKNPSTGEWEDVANFVDCVLWGTRAERVAQYLDKGTKVAIEGRLRYRAWEQDGQRRSKLEVVVDEIEFMSRQQQPQQAYQQPAPAYQQQTYAPPAAPTYAPAPQRPAPPRLQQTAMAMQYADDDIPF